MFWANYPFNGLLLKISQRSTSSDLCFVFLGVGAQTEAAITAGTKSFVLPGFHPAPGSAVAPFLCLPD